MDHTNNRLDIYRLRKNFDSGFANFTWGVRNGYPRATVFIFKRVSDSKVALDTYVPANMDNAIFNAFISTTIKGLKENKEGILCKVECKRMEYKDNRPTDNLFTAGYLVSGYDTNGLYLSVLHPDKPKIKFYLPISRFHTIQTDNELEVTEMNRLYAIGYIEAVSNTINNLIALQLYHISSVDNNKLNNDFTDDEIFNVL